MDGMIIFRFSKNCLFVCKAAAPAYPKILKIRNYPQLLILPPLMEEAIDGSILLPFQERWLVTDRRRRAGPTASLGSRSRGRTSRPGTTGRCNQGQKT